MDLIFEFFKKWIILCFLELKFYDIFKKYNIYLPPDNPPAGAIRR